MKGDLVSAGLKAALKQSGCPICRLRAESEQRYIRMLLWESVNDPQTRDHFIAALGYCERHTWQVGLVENEQFGCPLGNAIMYEHLAGKVHSRLVAYALRMKWTRRPLWRRWLTLLWPWARRRLSAAELRPQEPCRICQIGERSERRHLGWLLQHLSRPESDLRALYLASDGLCLPHLRQGLALASLPVEAGARFLVEAALHRLEVLQRDLSEFERKNAWDYRHEQKTVAESTAWLQALAFFGGTLPERRNSHD